MYILNESLNACSDAFLNARNRKISLLRIEAVPHFFFRDQKLDPLELFEVEELLSGERGRPARPQRSQGGAPVPRFWGIFEFLES